MGVYDKLSVFIASSIKDKFIGTTWHDGRGNERKVLDKLETNTAQGTLVRYLIGTGYNGEPADKDRNPEICKAIELEALIAREKRMWEANNKTRQQEEATREKEAREENVRNNIDGFDKLFSSMNAKKVLNTLTKNVMRNGKPIMLRDLIRQLVKEHWQIGSLSKQGRIMHKGDLFLTEKQLTKTGIDYAEFLINKG